MWYEMGLSNSTNNGITIILFMYNCECSKQANNNQAPYIRMSEHTC